MRRWGARAKVEAMQQQYPVLSARRAPPRPPAGASADRDRCARGRRGVDAARPRRRDGFDWFSVSKAAQAIAAEVELDGLLAQADAHRDRERRRRARRAGAGRRQRSDGACGGRHRLLRRCTPRCRWNNRRRCPWASSTTCAARRRRAAVGCRQRRQTRPTPMSRASRPRSWLCLPALKQGRLVGVLYLENRRAHGVFTARARARAADPVWRRRRSRWTTPGCSPSRSARSPNASAPRPG